MDEITFETQMLVIIILNNSLFIKILILDKKKSEDVPRLITVIILSEFLARINSRLHG